MYMINCVNVFSQCFQCLGMITILRYTLLVMQLRCQVKPVFHVHVNINTNVCVIRDPWKGHSMCLQICFT